MCGIVGYFDKSGAATAPVGATLVRMLDALACRGPDSAGIALWGPASAGVILRVKRGGAAAPSTRMPARDGAALTRPSGRGPRATDDVRVIERVARAHGRVLARAVEGEIVRLEVVTTEPMALARAIEAVAPDIEVVSVGRRLEIVKQVGAPRNLDAEFGVSKLTGTHGLGHTRLSTESRVDLSHSQPFWAHRTPDLAVVHNGHITNYHRLRRRYEQEGVRFYTENDSEIIGVYLARGLAAGASLREALAESVRELDGSFSYLVATADAFGFAKDRFCLKPLILAEDATAVAVANEEIALHAVLSGGYSAREAGAGAVAVWEVPTPVRAGRRQPSAPRTRPAPRAGRRARARAA